MAQQDNSFVWLLVLGVAGYLLYSRNIIQSTQTTPTITTFHSHEQNLAFLASIYAEYFGSDIDFLNAVIERRATELDSGAVTREQVADAIRNELQQTYAPTIPTFEGDEILIPKP